MSKKIISLLLVLSLIFTFASCNDDENTEETTTLTEETTLSSELVKPEETTLNEETSEEDEEESTETDFVFKSSDATKLGKVDSEIYGTLTLYLQDDKIVIFDEYKEQKFLLDANGYTTANVSSNVEVESEDLNFDGYSDFMLLYRETEFNTYYFCWLWDMDERTFEYYLPLSSIPSPNVEAEEENILSLNRTSATEMTVTTYVWVENTLVAQSHKTVTDEQQTVSSESVDSDISVTNNGYTAVISLHGNVGSSCQWISRIENNSVITLVANSFIEETAEYSFTITGLTPGTTTMVFRYALSWESDYVNEKVLNITVNDDYTLTIIEIV